MIPRDFITEWRIVAPWPSVELVEQDLVISRAILVSTRDHPCGYTNPRRSRFVMWKRSSR